MSIISESKNGRKRQVVQVGSLYGKRVSVTRHEVLSGDRWVHNPNTELSPWPAGKNFLKNYGAG